MREYYYYILQRNGKTALHEAYKKPLIFNTRQEAIEHESYLEKKGYKPVKVFLNFKEAGK